MKPAPLPICVCCGEEAEQLFPIDNTMVCSHCADDLTGCDDDYAERAEWKARL